MSVEICGGALRMCDRFRDDGSGVGITYELDADYAELLAKYRLCETAGEGSSLDRMTRLRRRVRSSSSAGLSRRWRIARSTF